jgi:hypothetical protein
MLLTVPAGAAELRDQAHGFSFTIPEGYRERPPSSPKPSIIHELARGTPEPGESFAVIQIDAMGGTIGREPFNRHTAEAAAHKSVAGSPARIERFDYRTARWQKFTLETMISYVRHGETELVTMATQVPLKREAIQIIAMGPANEEARIKSDFDAVLASLQGESNWLTTGERIERLGFPLGVLVGLAIAVFVVVRRRKR